METHHQTPARPQSVGQDPAVDHLGRERRLLRPRAAAGRAAGHAGRVPDRARHRRQMGRDRRARSGSASGFRCSCVAPFARGGFLCSDVFDHTSLLRFLETRFGAEVPNLSEWRRETTGDLTSALNLKEPDTSKGKLPKVEAHPGRTATGACEINEALVPPPNSMPVQPEGAPGARQAVPDRGRRFRARLTPGPLSDRVGPISTVGWGRRSRLASRESPEGGLPRRCHLTVEGKDGENMKRRTILGTCLVVSCGVIGMFASSASAALPAPVWAVCGEGREDGNEAEALHRQIRTTRPAPK